MNKDNVRILGKIITHYIQACLKFKDLWIENKQKQVYLVNLSVHNIPPTANSIFDEMLALMQSAHRNNKYTTEIKTVHGVNISPALRLIPRI